MGRGIGSYVRLKYRRELMSIGHCLYCGSTESLSIDHIYPLAKGGNSEPSNLTIACNRCNGTKGEFHIADFYTNILNKREATYSKLSKYIKRYRQALKPKVRPYTADFLQKKVSELRRDHTYYSRVINSIETLKYDFYGPN